MISVPVPKTGKAATPFACPEGKHDLGNICVKIARAFRGFLRLSKARPYGPNWTFCSLRQLCKRPKPRWLVGRDSVNSSYLIARIPGSQTTGQVGKALSEMDRCKIKAHAAIFCKADLLIESLN